MLVKIQDFLSLTAHAVCTLEKEIPSNFSVFFFLQYLIVTDTIILFCTSAKYSLLTFQEFHTAVHNLSMQEILISYTFLNKKIVRFNNSRQLKPR